MDVSYLLPSCSTAEVAPADSKRTWYYPSCSGGRRKRLDAWFLLTIPAPHPYGRPRSGYGGEIPKTATWAASIAHALGLKQAILGESLYACGEGGPSERARHKECHALSAYCLAVGARAREPFSKTPGSTRKPPAGPPPGLPGIQYTVSPGQAHRRDRFQPSLTSSSQASCCLSLRRRPAD